uniref:Methyltransferase domain-containing protein n=1 Tax=Acrobeloides nanus TaxID=290746 RepID=A0A914CBT1_9BILA
MADELRQKLFGIASNGALSLTIALGVKLGIFDALAETGTNENPATSEQVAAKAGLKTRYVKEWLCAIACGGLIEVDESGEKFWISEETKGVLSGPNKEGPVLFHLMMPILGSIYGDISKVFEKNGPLGMNYSAYGEFYEIMNQMSHALHKQHLVPSLIPMIGMKEKLEKGIQVLDVGCGKGFHIFELASHFPNSHFTGVDLTPSAIEGAEKDRIQNGAKNVEFICQDAKNLDSAWKDKFDLVFIFDACHDQTRPDLCMKEIHRVLKPDGLFAMIEVDSSGNCYVEKTTKGPLASMFYANSLFHCLPVGASTEDALALGSMWGVERGQNLLKESGFSEVKVEKTLFFPFNVLYTAKK